MEVILSIPNIRVVRGTDEVNLNPANNSTSDTNPDINKGGNNYEKICELL